MKYIISCNKMKTAKSLMDQFIEKLKENQEIASISESTKTVYLCNGDSYKFCTTKMRNSQFGSYTSQKIIREAEFRTAVWNYNPIRDYKFHLNT